MGAGRRRLARAVLVALLSRRATRGIRGYGGVMTMTAAHLHDGQHLLTATVGDQPLPVDDDVEHVTRRHSGDGHTEVRVHLAGQDRALVLSPGAPVTVA